MNLTSINNPKVNKWLKLKTKKYRDETNLFLIEGDHLLKEALDNGCVQEIIALDKSYEVAGIDFYLVNEAIMKKLSNELSIPKVIGVCQKLKTRRIKGKVCLLDSIQDPGNLGTIIRSAAAFNIDTIILSETTVDLYNEKVIRATEGLIFKLNFKRGNLISEINELKKEGYTIYGTDVREGLAIKTLAKIEKCAIIIGNEGNGMHPEVKNKCDGLLNIPIACESLNAAVAASIIFYELES